MRRVLSSIALVGLMAGCTRYGTNPPGGPFAPKPANAPAPAAPVPNNSPLALGAAPAAAPAYPTIDDTPAVPPRPPEGVVQAGGAAFPPRRNSEPQPDQLPSPFAPKTSAPASPPANPVAAAPPGPSPEAVNIAAVKKLAVAAAEKWSKVNTYEAVATRRELTPAKEMSGDTVIYRFRKEPMSVYIKNLGEAGKGRELLYNQKTDKIYVVLGEGDHKFMPAGFRAPPMSPDDPRVKEKSRYSIRDAGYGTPINKLGSWVQKAEAGRIPADALKYLGPVDRKEYPYPLCGVSLKLRPGDDPMMPQGGTRYWYFDTRLDSDSNGWPVLIIAAEPGGREVEYYLFEKVKLQIPLTDADFSPDRLGKK